MMENIKKEVTVLFLESSLQVWKDSVVDILGGTDEHHHCEQRFAFYPILSTGLGKTISGYSQYLYMT